MSRKRTNGDLPPRKASESGAPGGRASTAIESNLLSARPPSSLREGARDNGTRPPIDGEVDDGPKEAQTNRAPRAEADGRPEAEPAIRILIADDHPIYLEGLSSLIDRQPGMTVVAQAGNGRDALEAYRRSEPDIGLIDLRMPGLDGIATIAAIREIDPVARLVVLSSFSIDEDIYRALRSGARGYLLKDMASEQVIDCIRAVHGGRTSIPPTIAAKLAERVSTVDLTVRERQVLALVAKGLGNRDIGGELTVTEGTVKVHVNNILAKLGVASRTEAVTLALRRGLVRLED